MKLLSIIVPMYNVAPYVERCIRSLENQDIPRTDFDIICINDGSPDNCSAIVGTLQKEFDNIILINQENQGVSMARNTGINKAKGKYLLFVDPDDYVESGSFAHIIKIADEQNAEVSFLGYNFLKRDGLLKKEILNRLETGEIYPGTEAYYLARADGRTDPDRMVAVLFDREFINFYNLRYLPNVPYLEDGEFLARILCLAKRCIFCGHFFYQRTTRPGSATNSKLFYSKKAIDGFIIAARNLLEFKSQKFLTAKQKEFLNQPIVKFSVLPVAGCASINSIKMFKYVKQCLVQNNPDRLELEGCNRLYSGLGRIFNFSMELLLIYLVAKNINLAMANKILKLFKGKIQ